MKTRNVVIIVTAVIFISFAISTFSSIVSQSSLGGKLHIDSVYGQGSVFTAIIPHKNV